MLNEGRDEIIQYSLFLVHRREKKWLPFSVHLFCAISCSGDLMDISLLILNTILYDDIIIHLLLKTCNVLMFHKPCYSSAFICPLSQKAKLRCRKNPLTRFYRKLCIVTKWNSLSVPTPSLRPTPPVIFSLFLTLHTCRVPFPTSACIGATLWWQNPRLRGKPSRKGPGWPGKPIPSQQRWEHWSQSSGMISPKPQSSFPSWSRKSLPTRSYYFLGNRSKLAVTILLLASIFIIHTWSLTCNLSKENVSNADTGSLFRGMRSRNVFF